MYRRADAAHCVHVHVIRSRTKAWSASESGPQAILPLLVSAIPTFWANYWCHHIVKNQNTGTSVDSPNTFKRELLVLQNCRRPESPAFPGNGLGLCRCSSTIRVLPGRRDGRNKPKHQQMRLSVSRNMARRKATRPTRRTSVRCSTIVTTARQQKTQVVVRGKGIAGLL